jgi:hypothetical protein
MAQRLNFETATRPVNATAAGATAINGTGYDMQDYEGILFICAMGTLSATQVTSLKAQGSADNSAFADITGAATAAAADPDSNKLLVLDVYRPQQRYVRPVVNRATANAVIDGVIALRYGQKKVPTTQPTADVSQSKAALGV